MEPGEGVEQPGDRAAVDHADHQPAADQAGYVVHRVPNGVHRCQCSTGVLQCGCSSCGQGGDTARAVDESGTEVVFQLPDLSTDPRLAYVHPLGGPGEVGFFGHGHEVLELAELHIPRF